MNISWRIITKKTGNTMKKYLLDSKRKIDRDFALILHKLMFDSYFSLLSSFDGSLCQVLGTTKSIPAKISETENDFSTEGPATVRRICEKSFLGYLRCLGGRYMEMYYG